MGVYKVIQDIEAEDKLLGPLTLKQFIFAIIGVLFYYLSFLVITKHAAFMLIVFLPPALVATFFAWPWSADQPTEIWALAKLRFFFKPRRRIWDQSGVKDLVTITVPKRVAEPMRSNGLSQREVNSRLGALASTIDSRGWAIKNVNINLSAQPSVFGPDGESDRLLTPSSFPQQVQDNEIQAADDILDEHNNPIAQQFDQMISAATQAHRQQLVQMMSQPQLSLPAPQSGSSGGSTTVADPATEPAGPERSKLWFLNRPGGSNKRQQRRRGTASNTIAADPLTGVAPGGMVAAATPTAEEEALGQQLKAEHEHPNDYASRMKTIKPLGPTDNQTDSQAPASLFDDPTSASPVAAPVSQPVVTPPPAHTPDPVILQLASNNDLNVATLAREAHKKDQPHKGEFNDNEVVISLH